MNEARRQPSDPTSHWLLVLCLVGLDYFSTLAYLPSIAVAAAGELAPLAALAVVLATVCLALPVYAYVVGRSPCGRGAAGLLEQAVPGWRGKLLVLTLLGFAAADFVITRSLSVADAAVHVRHNPHGNSLLDGMSPAVESLGAALGDERFARLQHFFPRQVVITLLLSVLTFGFWQLMHNGFTRRILCLAGVFVTLYLAVVGIVIGSGLWYLADHPERTHAWWDAVVQVSGGSSRHPYARVLALVLLALWAFPQLALGLSGFELTMTIAPLVRGAANDDPTNPRGRVRNTRKLLCAAVSIMSVFLLGSVFVTTLLVPPAALESGGPAEHRALAYLAHGGALADGQPAAALNGWFGNAFGNLYDLSTIVVLSLAGASVVSGLRGVLPHYLHRLGMALTWAGRTGIVMHLLNVIILVVTLVFHASLSAQQWAYATSVLVLLAGAALAAGVDARRRWHGSAARWLAVGPLALVCGFFVAMTGLTAYRHYSGLVIALTFVATIVLTSFISRWLRSTELRFDGFSFRDEATRARWEAICQREFQVVVPHRPGLTTLAEKNRAIHDEYRLRTEIPILFVQASLGDPSDFYQQPLMQIVVEDSLEVVRVSKCASISHVLAALCLALCRPGGRPPEVIFGWSIERPMAANLHFLLLGEGNVPWMVKELVRHAVPDVRSQPRILIG